MVGMRTQFAAHVLRSYRRTQNLLTGLEPTARSQACASPNSAQPRRDIIVFPGSFNPPTVAHLAMLRQASRWSGWQVYTALSTHIVDKEAVERLTLLDRVMLIERVLHRHVRRAGILLLNRGLYVEQAQSIRAAFPHIRRLTFLLGFDKIVQILDPHYYTDREVALRTLFGLAQLLVAPRGADGIHQLEALLAEPENRRFARHIRLLPLAAKYRNVSSTRVRRAEEAEHSDLPQEVQAFLWYTRAYAAPLHRADGSYVDVYAMRTRTLQRLLNGADGEISDC
jgi:nicotinamide-nucleotide adenylyltransferase